MGVLTSLTANADKLSLIQELINIYNTPVKTLADLTHGDFAERLNRTGKMFNKLDARNITADHYLLFAETCPLKNTQLGCKVTYMTFKQGRSQETTHAYLISDLENVGQETIERFINNLLIKIPERYKEDFLLPHYRKEHIPDGDGFLQDRAYYPKYHPVYWKRTGALYYHGLKKTISLIVGDKIRFFGMLDQKARYEYIERIQYFANPSRKISAANLKRIQHWVDTTAFGCISACRGDKTITENKANTKKLEALIRKQKDALGYIKIQGSYLENKDEDEIERLRKKKTPAELELERLHKEKLERIKEKPTWVKRKLKDKLSEEKSFFIFVKDRYQSFNLLNFLLTLGNKFEQEAIVYGKGKNIDMYATKDHYSFYTKQNQKAGQKMATFKDKLWGLDPEKEEVIFNNQAFSRIKNQVFGFTNATHYTDGEVYNFDFELDIL